MSSQHHDSPSLGRLAAAFLTVYFIWGTTNLAIKFTLEEFPPFLFIGVRYLLAGTVMLAIARARGRQWPDPRQWRIGAVGGFLLIAMAQGLVVWGQLTVPSGLAALLSSTSPIWITLLSAVLPNTPRPTLPVYIGIALCIYGVTLPLNPLGQIGGGVDIAGAIALMSASMFWGFGAMYSRGARGHSSVTMTSGMQFLSGGIMLTLFSFFAGEFTAIRWELVTWRGVTAFFYLLIFGSVIAYTCYFWLMKVSTPFKVATTSYVNPLVAAVMGVLLGGETISLLQLQATPIILLGLFLISTARARRPTIVGSTVDTAHG